MPNRGQFRKGTSGNPRGRPKGSVNRTTAVAQKLFSEHGEHLLKKTIEMGLSGDIGALRLLLPRYLPARRTPPTPIDLPATDNPKGVSAAIDRLIAGVAAAEITAEEARDVARLLAVKIDSQLVVDLAARIDRLEVMVGKAEAVDGN